MFEMNSYCQVHNVGILITVCGGQLTNSSHGNINSPGYPGPYPNNRDCVWVVSVPPGNNIIIHFAYLAIEHHINCSYDYLEVCIIVHILFV